MLFATLRFTLLAIVLPEWFFILLIFDSPNYFSNMIEWVLTNVKIVGKIL